MKREIRVYVCPSCDHYYGTALMGDLSKEWVGQRGLNGEYLDRDRTRADCPFCYDAGKGRVRMVLMKYPVQLPEQRPEPEPIPTSGRYAKHKLVDGRVVPVQHSNG